MKINNQSNYNTNNAKENSNRYFLSLQVYSVLLYKIRIGEFRLSCVSLQIDFKLLISVINIQYMKQRTTNVCKGEIALLLYDVMLLRLISIE